MSELGSQIDRYLEDLARSSNSPHTVSAYRVDLREFLSFLAAGLRPGPAIDVLRMRGWLAGLYRQQLSTVTIRRKLAAVRGLFHFLLREGVVKNNVARLVRTPKAPKNLPDVTTPSRSTR